VDAGTDGRELLLGIRPEDLRVHPPSGEGLDAELSLLEPLGGETILYFEVGSERVRVLSPPRTRRETGERVSLTFDLEHLHLFSRKTEERIVYSGEH
jgi:ABC-type sugar transport system ATPase subunit